MIQITLIGTPISSQNAYGQRGKIRFMKAEAKKRKYSYIEQIKKQYTGPLLSQNLIVTIKLYFADKRIRDRDNRHKISMDALEGLVVENDNQFDCGGVYRFIDKNNPRIELEIK